MDIRLFKLAVWIINYVMERAVTNPKTRAEIIERAEYLVAQVQVLLVELKRENPGIE